MSLPSLSIERPVLATVISIVILLFGAISIPRLGVREYPSIDPPIITVSTTYTGAPSEVIESQITEPLEENLNSVPGIRTLSSVSRDGRSTITVEFELGVDLEAAANDVRDRASRAQRDLPPDADPPVVTKADADSQPILMLSISSNRRDLLEITDIADRRFKPLLQTIAGVSDVDIWGEKRYAMRIWLDRDRLASYGLTPVDVRNALQRENVELPSGRIDGHEVELSVRAQSRFSEPKEFNELVIRESGGQTVRLEDVGYASLGPENLRSVLKRDGVPMVAVVLRPQPGANQIEISDEFHRRLALIEKDLPEDVTLAMGFDTTEYIRASIIEVEETIAVAISLVVLIIFLFLRSWRSTLIPALAIPVSLLGGFFIMEMAGFSINVLTLLAMVLAIGLVVDDAIVVLENIYAKIEAGMDPRRAAHVGSQEVYVAVIATTVVVAAVFLPILFLGGVVGRLFREFGIVVAGTVIISAVVALTLTPMLCARFLRAHDHSGFYERTEPFFEAVNRAYRRSIAAMLRVRVLAVPLLLATGGIVWLLFGTLESELAPIEDRSRLRIQATAPEGASYDFMSDTMDQLGQLVSRVAPESTAVITITSPGGGAASSVNSGFIRIVLADRDARDRGQSEIARALLDASSQLPASRVSVIEEPSITTGGGGAARLPVQFVLQAPNLQKLESVLPDFLQRASDSGVFSRVDVDLKFNKPELRIDIDRERAQSLGVSAMDIGETLDLALSEQRMGYFLKDGKQYFVLGALVREHRDDGLDLRNLAVPSSGGSTVRLDNVVKLSEQTTPPLLLRFNRYVAATVSAGLNPGESLGKGIETMEVIADQVLDDTFKTDLAGQARDLRDSSSSLVFAFVLALGLIYLALAAQFESFRDPIVILLTVPLALLGALGFLMITGQTLNIFSNIGIIMLIGLVTKNGILIVEFANQRRAAGAAPLEAVLEAAASRFRPVLMTSFCTILGILPIALALGAGSESRRSMGIAVVGGMLVGTLLTLYVVPMMYALVTSRERVRAPAAELAVG